ncbi:MAG: hypothetical protein M0Z69_07345 [Actinomycetota bacterium]|nr:hypothetical protein [Actinomycetota bacterium]
MPRYAVEVLLDDRPGALGLVASLIGELGGDVVDIDVIEHFPGQVRDEITVDLPSDAVTGELASCLGELKGVVLEHLAPVGQFGHHLLVDALEVAGALVAERDPAGVLDALVTGVQAAFGTSWVLVATDGGQRIVAAAGEELPEPSEPVMGRDDGGVPLGNGDDRLVLDLGCCGARLVVGRNGWPFRNRELRELSALARIAGERWSQVAATGS